MLKFLKMTGILIGSLIAVTIIVVILFINLSPQFGKGVSKDQKKKYAESENHQNGIFVNRKPAIMKVDFWDMLKKMIEGSPYRQPKENISVEKVDSVEIVNHEAAMTQLTWFGHSTFLLEIEGKKILIDPMFGNSPSPLPLFGAKRYSKELPIQVEKLPFIDAVIFSHDHYDHLDYESIQRLKGKVGEYYTPLGIANHLTEWGVSKEKIHELNWWESISFDGIKLTCTPARHFSGRGPFDRASTLWCSWVITGAKDNIFFSGDSGYDEHFKQIGDKYGPFDISLMECGQYNDAWKAIHMMPEETVQASIDLKSKLVLPIHWGAFTLSFHDWEEPVVRFTKKAKQMNLAITTPKIGETIVIGSEAYPSDRWWESYVLEKVSK